MTSSLIHIEIDNETNDISLSLNPRQEFSAEDFLEAACELAILATTYDERWIDDFEEIMTVIYKEILEAHGLEMNGNHYLMPNGAQVKWITRYLTSNGGQAVQYLARATRLDGLNKHPGNEIEDLEKARDFINDEIYRLRQEQKENNA
jgi:hypothetical protein